MQVKDLFVLDILFPKVSYNLKTKYAEYTEWLNVPTNSLWGSAALLCVLTLYCPALS